MAVREDELAERLLEQRVYRLLDERSAALARAAREQGELDSTDLLCLADLLQLSQCRGEPLVALLLVMLRLRRAGSLCLQLEPERLARHLQGLAARPGELARYVLAMLARGDQPWRLLIGDGSTSRPLVRSGERLYFQRAYAAEQRLREHLLRLLAPETPLGPTDMLREALQAVLAAPPAGPDGATQDLNPEQLRAVALALLRPFTIVSGGPGTGKTSIVVTLLRTLVRLGVAPDQVRLAAPTGRAAQRLSESVDLALQRLPAQTAAEQELAELRGATLHQLLVYNPETGGFRHGEEHPLPLRVLIVDEASMVDVALMAGALAAVPEGARVVLLGDKDQLPSVDAGAVLADLMPPAGNQVFSAPVRDAVQAITGTTPEMPLAQLPNAVTDRVALLLRSYRSQADILEVAAAINRQDRSVADNVPALSFGPRSRHYPTPEGGVGLVPLRPEQADKRRHLLARWVAERWLAPQDGRHFHERVDELANHPLPAGDLDADHPAAALLRGLFVQVQACRILTLQRRGELGCAGINERLAAHLRQRFAPGSSGAFYVGAPLIVTRNDRRLHLFNGDVGLVVMDRERALRAVFPRRRGYLVCALDVLPTCELAYAITVHKSQGSEFDDVLLVLPAHRESPLLSKEILYTGLTRARHRVVIAGGRDVLRAGIARHIERHSGLDVWRLAEGTDEADVAADLPLFQA